MKRLLFLLLGFFLVVKPVFAATYPSPTGNISDFSGTLTAQQIATIDSSLQNYRDATGNQIAVAVIKDLGGDTVENYAVNMFAQWKIGQKDKNNGVLLLISMAEHKIKIEVGYGLESELTDAKSGDIIRNAIAPKFKTNDYYGGIKDGVNAIENTLSGQQDYSSSSKTKSDFLVGLLSFVLFFGFWAITAILRKVTKILADIPGFWAGPIGGLIAGAIIGFFIGSVIGAIVLALVLGFVGFILDYFASNIYHALDTKNKSSFLGRSLFFWSSFGPRNGGGGSEFSGFSGGSSGGGGSSGSW